MDFNQEHFCVDHIGLLSHGNQTWQVFKLNLWDRFRTQTLFVLFKCLLQLLQLNFENFDVVDVFISLLFQIIDFGGKLPLVFLAVFDLSQTNDGVALGEGANVGVRILHNHVVVWLRLPVHLFTILLAIIPLACFLLLHLHNLPLLFQG